MVNACRDTIYAAAGDDAELHWEAIAQAAGILLSAPASTTTWEDLDSVIGPVEWAWPNWLPKGFLSMVASEPGIGKSTLALRIAAAYTSGWDWPDGTPFTDALGSVLWCETESGEAMNLARARDWELPLRQFRNPLGDPFETVSLANPKHIDAIKSMAEEPDVKFIVLDSLTGAHHCNEKDSSDMFPLLKQLADIIRDTNKPMLITHHLRKAGAQDSTEVTLDRVRGGTGIVQLTRAVWAIDRHNLLVPDQHRLHVIKSNLAKYPPPLVMKITDTGIDFDDAPQQRDKTSALEDAIAFLKSELQGGMKPSKEVAEAAEAMFISTTTLQRARKVLGVEAKKIGAEWYLMLRHP